MNDTNQLQRIETAPAQLQAPAPVNVSEIIGDIMKKGVDPSAAAVAIKELVQLQNQQEDRWSKQQFVQAFMRARGQMKTIQAEKAVPGKNDTVRWYYATLEDLQDAVEPICDKEGLAISFDSRREGNVVIGVCIVYHESGHEERRECSINVANAEGGDLGAMKKAKRGAMTAMFGIKTQHMNENDPRIMGDLITPEEAEELDRRCEALGSAKYTKSLLKYLGAETFSDVYSSRLADARRSLTQAETKVKANPSPQGGAAAPRNAPPSLEIPTSGGGAGPHQPSAPQTTAADVHGSNPAQDVLDVRTEPSAPVKTSPAQTGRVGPAAREEGSGAKAEVREIKPNESAPSSPGAGGGVGGGVLPQSSVIAPTSPPVAPDAWEHWRTMSPADTRGTWEAMSGDGRASAWAKMPKDVRAVVRAKLETTK